MARGIHVTHPRIERYMASLIPPRDPVLRAMERRAERAGIPIVGPAVGRILMQLALMVRARRVMELGSAIGYSTIWLARAVGPRGRVWYTDGDEANAREAGRWARKAGVADRVTLLVGDALTSMAGVRGRFDIVFCDIDKEGYPDAFEASWKRLRKGGLFVCDNTLWSGRVTEPVSAARDPDTAAIRRMNRMTYADDARAFAVLLPVRDGLTVAMKR